MVFIAGNMPMKTEITPLLIITKLEQYDYAGATAIAAVTLLASFLILLSAINRLQSWSARLADGGVAMATAIALRGASEPAARATSEPVLVKVLL